MLRLVLILIVALAMAPGTWLRTPVDRQDAGAGINFTALPVPITSSGEAQLLGAWVLDSPDAQFGGFSALRRLSDNQFIAVSDVGFVAQLALPGPARRPSSMQPLPGVWVKGGLVLDMESLTYDSDTGQSWIGFEAANAIVRYNPKMQVEGVVRPRAMRKWGANSGPEAMVRLDDGRFIVLAEGAPWGDGPSPALLFPGDPVTGAMPVPFQFAGLPDHRPVDMAVLPDGRVLILLRQFHLALPPRFSGAIMLADPAAIAAGREWGGRIIARLEEPWPADNYEGLAIGAAHGDSLDLWVISDDNRSAFQRSVLLRLRWKPTPN